MQWRVNVNYSYFSLHAVGRRERELVSAALGPRR